MKRTHREDIAVRIADAVTGVLPHIEREIDWQPVLKHTVETIDLPRRMLAAGDVEDASSEAARFRKAYEEQLAEYEAHQEDHQPLEWYAAITGSYRQMSWNAAVAKRYARQHAEPTMPVEVHVLRLGDIAMATNPFECYLDFGLQIKAHSRAIQTFVVQLAGGDDRATCPPSGLSSVAVTVLWQPARRWDRMGGENSLIGVWMQSTPSSSL